MGRLRIKLDNQRLDDGEIRQGLLAFASNDEGLRVVRAMGQLMKSGHLGFWLSPQLMQKVRAFAAEQQGKSSQSVGEVDEIVLVSWLLKAGSMEPNVRWEIRSLPDNGGIYKILLGGGKK